MRSIQVTIQLQKQDNNETKPIRVSVHIKHSMTVNSTEHNNGDIRKYIMCSLLLQLGKILGIQPSYAPSPYISTIFTEIYNKWSLKCIESNTQYTRSIKQLADITDGNNLILCCGGYYKESVASMSNNCEQNLIDLIPSKCKVVSVSIVKDTDTLPSNDNTSAQSNNKDESDSDIEDVTELHAAKHKANQDIIDIDSGSDDEEKCFWEYDEYGNMKKTEAKSLFEYKSEDDDDVISISSGDSSSVEDVTAIMLEKRAAQAQKLREDAEEINDDDSDQDEKQHTVGKKRKRQHCSPSTAKRRKRKKVTESPIEVILEDKDIPICPGAKVTQDDKEGEDSSTNVKDKEQVDHSIKIRIIKLLNTGFHNNSNENEAKNALKLARRLMERHNLDQTLLLNERGDGSLNDCSTTANDDDGLQGGIVTTKIQNRKNGKPLSSLSRWQDFLVGCTCINFHVEAFKTVSRSTLSRPGECSVTFYGIRVNAQLAAYAFKIASERISLMAATYEPPRVSILTAASQKAKETRSSRLSYALGIVNGLEQDVKEGQRKEEENRKEKLRRAQQRTANSGEAHQESDDDSSGVAQKQGEFAKDEASSSDLKKLERENTAHLALIDHHKKIATDVLKSKKIKVRSARKPKSILLNRNAYEKGMVDSKEIDLNQQSIK